MAALVQRDVLPYWLAGQAPKQIFPDGHYQIAIMNDAGKRIGSTWVTTTAVSSISRVHSTTVIDMRQATGLIPWAGRVLLESSLTFDDSGGLSEFMFVLQGAGIPVHISGARYGRDFACTAKIGSHTTTIPFDAQFSEYLGEAMRPFTHLRDLHVGQTWRIRTVDPFALVKGQSLEFQTELAKVVRREKISHEGTKRDCFRIESHGVTAWAEDSGLILRQEVELPLLGRWIMLDEPYDQQMRKDAVSQFRDPRESPDVGDLDDL